MAKKKSIVGDLPSASRGRIKLANTILKESFSDAYPEEISKESDPTNEVESVEVTGGEEANQQATAESQTTEGKKAELSVQKSEKKVAAKRKSKGPKSTKIEKENVESDQPKEFTTLNCLKTTHSRTSIVSALVREPVYRILDEAIDDYIAKLRKSGKITFDI